MADQTQDNETFKPLTPDSEFPPEFTLRAALAGIFFGIIFGAANTYLGLRVGLTISTSIPVAVMTVAFFTAIRRISRPAHILEANMSQTIGSASSSVASGTLFTIPALFLWGMKPALLQMAALGMLGGLIGVLFMVPLRRLLIVREHRNLPYPEGTACAEVLKASVGAGGHGRYVFLGLGMGALYKIFGSLLKLWPGSVHMKVPGLPKGEIGTDVSAALTGVGWILGVRVATVMVSGGLLSSLVIIPAIAIWGADRSVPLYPETVDLIRDMSAGRLWTRYVRYIGAGAVAMGGLLTLLRSLPTMIESFKVGWAEMKERMGDNGRVAVPRSNRDLSLRSVFLGAGAIALLVALVPGLIGEVGIAVRLLGATMVVILAFFFVTVSSRIVGLVGVTSNPTSGMTIAALLVMSGIFYLLGWTDQISKAAVLMLGTVVCVGASIAGDTSQDLKTGYLLGATPRKQQLGEIVGVLSNAIFVCITLLFLDRAYTFGSAELPAPQATLMKLVVEGVLDAELPWALVGIGMAIALVVDLMKLPTLAFAVGVYLPGAVMVPIFFGGLLRFFLERRAASKGIAASLAEKGVLFGSGLVGGEGLVGVGIAGIAFFLGHAPQGIGHAWAGSFDQLLGFVMEITLVVLIARVALSGKKESL